MSKDNEAVEDIIKEALAGAYRDGCHDTHNPDRAGSSFRNQERLEKILGYVKLPDKPLFELGNFILHSGGKSNFKINCSALTDNDWITLARVVYKNIAHFRRVVGIPQGGLKLAETLKPYCFPNPEYPTLIVDDVLTTGESMEEARKHIKGDVIGCVIFARDKCPSWVTPLFNLWNNP